MMKVALVNFCFEDYTIELANALAELVDLTLIQPEKVANVCRNAIDSSIQICSFKKPRIRDPRNIFSMIEMMRIIQDLQPDVLHVQETNDFWYNLALLFHKVPHLVTTVHDVFRHPGDREAAPGSEYTRLVSFYRSQQIIVHTQSLRHVLLQRFRISESRLNVIPHGELGSLYQRRSPGNPVARQPNTLLFFGRIWEYKGLKYLLEALPLIAEKIPDVKLIIAGKGENLDLYFPKGYDTKHIEILNNFIPTEAVSGLFQRSAVTILPYTEASQSGVAALSYGTGTPVIASDLGGLREMVRHGQDGLLVTPGNSQALANAVIQFLSDRLLQQQMQTAALARCQSDLDWSKIAAQTLDVYQKAISRSAWRKHNFRLRT